jgi:hypothetical protein
METASVEFIARPSGPARTLLSAIKADPEGLRRAGRGLSA